MAASAPGMRAALEATRGATLAVHAAAGLARPCQHAARLLRAAEGLCRTATAILLPTPEAQSSPYTDPAVSSAPRRRRRPRGQRKGKPTGTEVDTDMASQVAKEDAAAAASGPASVLTRARAPLLLQPAVGCAEPPELDDSWADDARGATLSLDASPMTGKGSGTAVAASVAAQASSACSTAASAGLEARVLRSCSIGRADGLSPPTEPPAARPLKVADRIAAIEADLLSRGPAPGMLSAEETDCNDGECVFTQVSRTLDALEAVLAVSAPSVSAGTPLDGGWRRPSTRLWARSSSSRLLVPSTRSATSPAWRLPLAWPKFGPGVR